MRAGQDAMQLSDNALVSAAGVEEFACRAGAITGSTLSINGWQYMV
jgi:hypothetical protein